MDDSECWRNPMESTVDLDVDVYDVYYVSTPLEIVVVV